MLAKANKFQQTHTIKELLLVISAHSMINKKQTNKKTTTTLG